MSSFDSSRAPAPGDHLAPFVVQTRKGAPFAWKPGRVTVISFCAMWCDTWKEQLPRLSRVESALKGLPVDFLAISVDGRWMDRSNDGRFANLLADAGGAWTASVGVDRVPYTLVLDRGGIVRFSAHGISRSEELTDEVRSAFHIRSGGSIYLEFEGISDEVLDALRTAKVHATFVCDSPVSSLLVERARREGHRMVSVEVSNRFVDDPFDDTRPGQKELVRRVLNSARPNAIVRLHAGVADTEAVLGEIISNLRGRGYEFSLLAKP